MSGSTGGNSGYDPGQPDNETTVTNVADTLAPEMGAPEKDLSGGERENLARIIAGAIAAYDNNATALQREILAVTRHKISRVTLGEIAQRKKDGGLVLAKIIAAFFGTPIDWILEGLLEPPYHRDNPGLLGKRSALRRLRGAIPRRAEERLRDELLRSDFAGSGERTTELDVLARGVAIAREEERPGPGPESEVAHNEFVDAATNAQRPAKKPARKPKAP